MAARVLDMRTDPVDPELLGEAVRHLEEGGLVAMPTETVYGFGCVVDPAPIRQVQRLKCRGPDKPFLLLVPSVDAVAALRWSPEARELARVFWPGALTLILPDPGGSFPPGTRSAVGGVAVRMSPHPLARSVVAALNAPVLSTSANRPGGDAALTAQGAREVAESLGAGEELWILDGGPLEPSDPSTIVDFTGPVPLARRLGAIPLNRLRCVVPEIHETT
jgi:L-threonylcarbamoyladenylate synthase